MADKPDLFDAVIKEMKRLHLSIWRMLHRMPNTEEPSIAHQAYHPAYLACRVQLLEANVGSLLGLLLQSSRGPGFPVIRQQEIFDLMGEVYMTYVNDLHAQAAIHSTAFHLAPHVRKTHLDEPVKVEDDAIRQRDAERARSDRLRTPAVPIVGSDEGGEPDAEE